MYPGMVPGPAMPMAMPMGPFVPGPVAPAPPGAGAGAPGRLGGGVARDSKAMAQAVAATRKKTQAGQESRHEMREVGRGARRVGARVRVRTKGGTA